MHPWQRPPLNHFQPGAALPSPSALVNRSASPGRLRTSPQTGSSPHLLSSSPQFQRGGSPKLGRGFGGASTPQMPVMGQISPGRRDPSPGRSTGRSTPQMPFRLPFPSPLSPQNQNVVPTALFNRMDGVVSNIEKEMGDFKSDPNINWLDNQIYGIEQRREACETRQKYLAELRRLVSDGKTREEAEFRNDANFGSRAKFGRNDQIQEVNTGNGYKGQSFGRLSTLERDHADMKQQVMRLEQYQSAKLQASEHFESEAQDLQNSLTKAELALNQERRFGAEAAQVQLTSEANLRSLEGKSREVLQDCRDLQATVARLESERHELKAEAEWTMRGLQEELSVALRESDSRLHSIDSLEQQSRDRMQLESQLQKCREELAEHEAIRARDIQVPSPSLVEDAIISSIKKLETVTVIAPRRPDREFLKNNRSLHHFIQKVSELDDSFRRDMDEAEIAHVQWTKAALSSMIQARADGRSLKMDFPDRAEQERTRNNLGDRFKRLKSIVSSCQQELQRHRREMSEDQGNELEAYLNEYMEHCDHEIELFQEPSLSHLHEEMLHVLVRVEELSVSDKHEPLKNIRTEDSEATLLHWAAQHGKRDILAYLLKLKGSEEMIHERDIHGRTPIFYADKLNHTLVERGATKKPVHAPDHPTKPRELLMLSQDKQEVLDQIETHGWNHIQFRGGYTLLHWAAYKGNLAICEYLLHLHGNPHSKSSGGCTPVTIARECNNRAVLELLEGGRRKHEIHHSHFKKRGIPYAYKNVFEEIEKRGWSEIEWAKNYTLLHWSAKNDRGDLCKHFMSRGADPNQRDDSYKSALDYAQDYRCAEALRALQAQDKTPLSPASMEALVFQDRNNRRGSVQHFIKNREGNRSELHGDIGESF